MQKIIFSNKFAKDYSLMNRRGKNINKLKEVIRLLEQKSIIPAKYKDHKLVGNYENSRELYIEPDWLLIYRVIKNAIILERTGTHSDLFK